MENLSISDRWLNQKLIGIYCSCINIGVGYPFELLKTRSQIIHPYHLFHDISFIYKKYHIKGFYNGSKIPFLLNVLTNDFQFHSYFYMKEHYHFSGFLSGAILGVFYGFFLNPFEVYKCKNQAFQIIKQQVNWMNGMNWTLCREISGFSIYFGVYEKMMDEKYPIWLSGGISGSLSWMISFPFDHYKSHAQTNSKIKTPISKIGLFLMIMRSFLVNSLIFQIVDNNKSTSQVP